MRARRFGDDRVMDVEDRQPLDVLHRRQLVHPLAVVALVVGMMMGRDESRLHQRRFDVDEPVLGHEDVDVRENSSACRREPGVQIGRTLEKDHGNAGGTERACELADFAAYCALLGLRLNLRGDQVRAWRRRNRVEQAAIGETRPERAEKIGLARAAHEYPPNTDSDRTRRRRRRAAPRRADPETAASCGAGESLERQDRFVEIAPVTELEARRSRR